MRKTTAALLGILLAVGLACWPTTTRVGVNFEVTRHQITLMEKAVHFVSRHWQTLRIARSVVHPSDDFEVKMERILAWVNRQVRPSPEGFPIVDDHPLHILLRGYGAPDQRAEAFALIASYSGLPAATIALRPRGRVEQIMLVLVRWKGNLYPVDVQRNLLFRDPDGHLAPLKELKRHPEWIEASAGERVNDEPPYMAFWHDLNFPEPLFTRMELQRPWSRAWVAVRRAARLGSDSRK
jgi:hypothetical protein